MATYIEKNVLLLQLMLYFWLTGLWPHWTWGCYFSNLYLHIRKTIISSLLNLMENIYLHVKISSL